MADDSSYTVELGRSAYYKGCDEEKLYLVNLICKDLKRVTPFKIPEHSLPVAYRA